MKILIATGIYPPEIGGPATYSKLLFDELPKRGIEVGVLPFSSVRAFPKVIRHAAYFFKVFRHAFGFDLIYAQDPFSVGFPALCAAKILRKRFILKVVGDYAWEQGTQRYGVTESLDDFSVKKTGYHPTVQIMKRVETFVASHADKIIVPSEYLKRIVWNWGVNKDDIHVIYNAFDGTGSAPAFSQQAQTGSSLIGAEKPKTILSVGRLVSWKGFTILIEIMDVLKDRYQGIELHIIGEGPERPVLEKLIARLDLGATVKLLGQVPREEVLRHLESADLFVLNTFYEGFSHQLLEALALGVPVVTTNVGGNPEIIESGKNGILVPYNNAELLQNAIEKLLADQSLRERYRIAGQAFVSGFTAERMIAGLIKELS